MSQTTHPTPSKQITIHPSGPIYRKHRRSITLRSGQKHFPNYMYMCKPPPIRNQPFLSPMSHVPTTTHLKVYRPFIPQSFHLPHLLQPHFHPNQPSPPLKKISTLSQMSPLATITPKYKEPPKTVCKTQKSGLIYNSSSSYKCSTPAALMPTVGPSGSFPRQTNRR